MKAPKRNTFYAVLVLLLVFGSPLAQAFFPIGGYDSFDVRRYVKWSFAEFDNNGNGSVDAGEGIGVLLESGPRGFNSDEIQIVKDALQVWEDVPTSFASFRVLGETQDILLSGVAPDGENTIVMQVTEADAENNENVEADPADVIVGVGNGVLGVTIILFSVDDVLVPIGRDMVNVPAGTIIDNDIIIDATSHRRQTPDVEPQAELLGTLVHELGHFLGIGHTPLNNLREIAVGGTFQLVESEPLALTGADGIQRRIGATPTMYPFLFSVDDLDDESEGLRDGGSDLAPDDISAVSWLYPRGSQANYFTVEAEARTRVRRGSGLPSTPITGGHVVAWADADDLDSTGRIPIFSTTTGLYERIQNPNLWGQFELIGMWKQLELVGAPNQLFTPTYSFTLSALNQTGATRQAPLGILPGDVDSIVGPTSFSTTARSTADYNVAFPSEVFQEVDNIVDVSNKDAGTPMKWDFVSNTLISNDTGRNLNTILNGRDPMFGDPNDVCPLNIISGSITAGGNTAVTDTLGGGFNGPENLRGFRDNYLLPFALGTVLVDAYYQVAPGLSRFFLDHPSAFDAWSTVVNGFYWTLEHPMKSLLGFGLLLTLALVVRRRRSAVVAGMLLVACSFLLALPAHATIEYLTTDELVARTDCVITGRVLATTGRWGLGGRIYTDVVLDVKTAVGCAITEDEPTGEGESEGEQGTKQDGDEIAKTLELTVLGGQLEGLIMYATSMPTFRIGEEVLLYLKEIDGIWIIYAGQRGKFNLLTISATGEKYVSVANPYSEQSLKEDLEQMPMRTDAKGNVFLDDYLAYIRQIKGE